MIPPYIRFRLYLGSPHDYGRAVEIVSLYFDAFSAFDATGFWKGQREATLVFETILPNKTGLETDAVARCAKQLAESFAQESVLMTAEPVPVFELVKP